nr:hypothetical protein [Tanacetum cinerariifolium]
MLLTRASTFALRADNWSWKLVGGLSLDVSLRGGVVRSSMKAPDVITLQRDPYAKFVKRVTVLAEEHMKMMKKENLDNTRQRIFKLKTIPREGRIGTGGGWIIKDHSDSEVIERATRYWDLRQQTSVHNQQLPNRCYALSVKHPLMVVGIADRNLIAFNLQNQVQHTFATPGSDGAFNF